MSKMQEIEKSDYRIRSGRFKLTKNQSQVISKWNGYLIAPEITAAPFANSIIKRDFVAAEKPKLTIWQEICTRMGEVTIYRVAH